MNNKGFTLVELLGCLVIIALILGIGLYTTRGTLSTAKTSLDSVSENEIYDASKMYAVENLVVWSEGDNQYACVAIENLVNMGYFSETEMTSYKDKFVKLVRDANTKVVNDAFIVDVCE